MTEKSNWFPEVCVSFVFNVGLPKALGIDQDFAEIDFDVVVLYMLIKTKLKKS